jgi:hypothetical protein
MAPMQASSEQATVTFVIMWGMPPQQPALTIHFFGAYGGRSTTRGDGNTAAGIHALYYNAGGDSNTGVGAHALLSNTSGNRSVGFN